MSTIAKREPLGVLACLSTGFDAVTRAPQVILVPVVLDLFLWLGPRLSAYPLIHSVAVLLGDPPPTLDSTARAQFFDMVKLMEQLGKQFNLFAWLSPFLMGVPSLIAGTLPDKSIWTSQVWEVNNVLVYLGLFVLFSVLGVGLNALYWSQIARTAAGEWLTHHNQPLPQVNWLAHSAQIWWGLLKLLIVLVLLSSLVGFPALVLATFIALVNPASTSLGMAMGMMVTMWIVFYLMFVVHGLALREGRFIEAVRISVNLVRQEFFSTSGLVALGAIIYFGVGVVWALPADDSWLKAGAIVGNAFIASGVLSATVFFYLERVPQPNADPPK